MNDHFVKSIGRISSDLNIQNHSVVVFIMSTTTSTKESIQMIFAS